MAVIRKSTKGQSKTVDPIRDLADVTVIKRLLADRPRDLALFTVGANTNLRASDLLRITVGHVRHLQAGESFNLIERKTSKARRVTINNSIAKVVQTLLLTLGEAQDEDLLFQSRKGKGQLTTIQLNRLVKSWCVAANIKGNFGSHTLRKTWAHAQYKHFGAELPALMRALNHSSQAVTLGYIGLQERDVADMFANEI